MMKTTSRLEVLRKTIVEAGKGKTPKGLKKLCEEEGKQLKSLKTIAGFCQTEVLFEQEVAQRSQEEIEEPLEDNGKC
jgi:hypothetical protein